MEKLEAIRARCREDGQCWIWQGGCDGKGRPQIRHDGIVVYTRRLARQLSDGKPVPRNMRVPSECGRKLCVSPECSVVGTVATVRRMAADRGAYSKANRNLSQMRTKRARSAISDETVQAIRNAPGPCSRIAAETGVSESHIKAIRRGTARRDLSNPFGALFRATKDAA
jgi:hypothetical protein